MKKAGLIIFFLIFGCCVARLPGSFIEIKDPSMRGLKVIELRDGLTYNKAWRTLIDTVAVRWDIQTMDKDAGYLRSGWAYSSGKDKISGRSYTYGRRLSAKFLKNNTLLQIKTEAFYKERDSHTIYGMDSAFNEDVYTEIFGKLGRTSR